METGTAFFYLLNSIKEPSMYDIRSLSADFITRISPEHVGSLNSEINGEKCPFKPKHKPENDAQMQAYTYANLLTLAHDFDRLLQNHDRDLTAARDYSIIDYGCGIGLSSVALIHYFKTQHWEECIKEVILVEDNEACLQRAELLVKSVLPEVTIRVVQKPIDRLLKEDTESKHLMTYHLFCSDYNHVEGGLIKRMLEDNRYLFATAICRLSNINGTDISIEHRDGDFGIIKRTDMSTVVLPQKPKDPDAHFNSFYSDSDAEVIGGEKSKWYTLDDVPSYVNARKGSENDCLNYFKNRASFSVLARINYARCLAFGIGCKEDKEKGKDTLTILLDNCDSYSPILQASILNTYALCSTDREEREKIWRRVTLLDIEEHKKCSARINITINLRDKDNSGDEIETLCRKCIKNGCIHCDEASNYDEAKKICPRAQYELGCILGDRKEYEASFELIQAAADQGYNAAINYLGAFYDYGVTVEKDLSKAISLYKAAAEDGFITAQINMFEKLKNKNKTLAIWYLALACNAGNVKAQEKMIEYIPHVFFGNLLDQQIGHWAVTLAEEGVEKYKPRAICFLVDKGDTLMKEMDIEGAREQFERLEQFDSELSKEKLQELNMNTPDWWYHEDDVYIEPYSYLDSLSDAFDDEPGAYWNID